MKKLFRILVIVSTVFYIVWFFSPYFYHLYLSDEVINVIAYTGYGSILPNGPYTYIPIFIISMVIAIGLYLFKPWARTSFVVLYAIFILASPFWGLNIQSGLDVMIGTIATLSDGALIGLMYFSTIGNEFNRTLK